MLRAQSSEPGVPVPMNLRDIQQGLSRLAALDCVSQAPPISYFQLTSLVTLLLSKGKLEEAAFDFGIVQGNNMRAAIVAAGAARDDRSKSFDLQLLSDFQSALTHFQLVAEARRLVSAFVTAMAECFYGGVRAHGLRASRWQDGLRCLRGDLHSQGRQCECHGQLDPGGFAIVQERRACVD